MKQVPCKQTLNVCSVEEHVQKKETQQLLGRCLYREVTKS